MIKLKSILLAVFIVLSFETSAQCPEAAQIKLLLRSPESKLASGLDELRSVLRSMEQCGLRSDSLYGLILCRISGHYSRQGKHVEAVAYGRRAISAFRSSTLSEEQRLFHMAHCYFMLNLSYNELAMRSEYIDAIDSCIAVEKRLNTTYRYTCFVMQDKVLWLFTRGDFKLCIRTADHALSLINTYCRGSAGEGWSTYILMYQVQAMMKLGMLNEAEKLLDNQIRKNYMNSSKSIYPGLMYGLAAQLNSNKQEWRKALHNSRMALAAHIRSGYKKGCAESLISIARIAGERLGDTKESSSALLKALRYADKVDSVHILDLKGNLLAAAGNFTEAFKAYSAAFGKIAKGMNITGLDAVTPEQTANTNLNVYISQLVIDFAAAKLQFFKISGDSSALADVINISTQGDAFMSMLKNSILETESNLSWRNRTKRLYENAIEACYLAGNMERAFDFFEKSRAVLLTDKLDLDRQMSESELMKQAELETREQELNRKLESYGAGTAEYLETSKELYAITSQQETLVKKLRPEVSVNKFPLSSLAEVQARLLVEHSGLIEFFDGDSAVYMLYVLQEKTFVRKMSKARYEQLVDQFLYGFHQPVRRKSAYDKMLRASSALYDFLFRDIELRPGRIIISPDGKYFPLEALVSKRTTARPHYLVYDYAFSYTYSARYLMQAGPSETADARSFLGIAPVEYAAYLNLTSLKGSDLSLANIIENFEGPASFAMADATRGNFLSALPKHRIIHLYSHASTGKQGEPVLYFRDSSLALENLIIRERPATRLVVLAACESGLGKSYPGEGVFSFNRAFATLGIPSAIVNLWPVENKTTYRLNELFYKHLAKGKPIDLALQEAKLEYLSTGTEMEMMPYYWAATILTGKTDAISGIGVSWPVWIAASLLLIMLLLAILWVIRIRSVHGS